MIFARDARGEIRWFYPACEREGINPQSIPIAAKAAHKQLPDAVRQDFAPGPLEIEALFSRQPFGVLEVESWLKQSPDLGERVARLGGALRVVRTRVEGTSVSEPRPTALPRGL